MPVADGAVTTVCVRVVLPVLHAAEQEDHEEDLTIQSTFAPKPCCTTPRKAMHTHHLIVIATVLKW